MSAPLWTSEDAVVATGGQAQGRPWQATGLSIDTRSLVPGDLFIALTDRRDGHDFVGQALAAGAAAALVSRLPDGLGPDAPLLLVDDVLAGLRALAAHRRAATRARVIAVTGSVGKTSTKEMLRAALAPFGAVHAAEKSFNNHWGVPLTLARCPLDCDFAVVEIGMNHPGEIAPLALLSAPDIGLITTVAPAHLEAFGRIEGIAEEKASLFSGVRSGGVAIWNADLPTSPILRHAAAAAAQSVSFGQSAGTDVTLRRAANDRDGLGFDLEMDDQQLAGRLSVPGLHLAMNAAAVLATVRALGLDPVVALERLACWSPPEGRGTRTTLALLGGGEIVLIDEAYNANPASMAAALDTLASTEARPGRRVAVLGDMLELGPDEGMLHAGLAALPAFGALDLVHCVGPRMRHLWQAMPAAQRGLWAESAEALVEQVGQIARAGDVVMIKGSLGSRVGQVVMALRRMADAEERSG
ncbi:MAG: UDP-N-acetylmuramoyl-tripeptide--D-alanyl-D-alanine ligase [Qingshengfaniella sp.]